jgi:heme oxygenase (mycobilin-producing)
VVFFRDQSSAKKGDAMAVKVLITRQFKKDKMNEGFNLLMELRSLATLQSGYVSGETLVSADNPNKLLVISTWVSRKRWEEWQANKKRKDFEKRMKNVLEGPEMSELFFVGEKMQEWVDMA